MSRSEPGEMAPESSTSVVIPKFDMQIYTSSLTLEELNQAIKEFYIPTDLRPRLPSPDLTMNKLPNDVIGIYVEQLDHGGMRILFSTFLLAVIRYFRVHISQLVLMGGSRVTMFEVRCRTLNFEKLEKKFLLIDMRAISKAMLWRRIDTDVQDDFPINYNEEDTDRIAELSTSGVISCDQGSRRQGDYHGRFLEASRLEHDFGDVKKSDQKISKAQEKKEKLALTKVNTKPVGEDTIFVAPIHQSIPKPLYETAELKGKEVETSIVNLSDHTREATPSLVVRTLKEQFIQVDDQTKNANVLDAHSYHSVHKEENDEDADDHCYIPTWGLRSDLRISSYRACKEMISHLATPPKKEVLSSLTNYEVVRRTYQSLGRSILSQAKLLKEI
ncbi:hypothetical protein Tco_1451237 [Tanacetum coccineum]